MSFGQPRCSRWLPERPLPLDACGSERSRDIACDCGEGHRDFPNYCQGNRLREAEVRRRDTAARHHAGPFRQRGGGEVLEPAELASAASGCAAMDSSAIPGVVAESQCAGPRDARAPSRGFAGGEERSLGVQARRDERRTASFPAFPSCHRASDAGYFTHGGSRIRAAEAFPQGAGDSQSADHVPSSDIFNHDPRVGPSDIRAIAKSPPAQVEDKPIVASASRFRSASERRIGRQAAGVRAAAQRHAARNRP